MIQLTLHTDQEVRFEIPVDTIEECFEAARQAAETKIHQGEQLAIVAAGCRVLVTDKPA